MSVHLHKDGRWYVQYRDNAKKSGYTREYFGRGLDSEQAARDRNDALNLNPYVRRTPEEGTHRFIDIINAYLKAKVSENERNTIEILQYKLDANIVPAFGSLPVPQITPGRVDGYVKKRLDAGVKRSTVNRELTDIISILNWAVDRGHIKYNPLHKYRKPKIDDEIIYPPTSAEITGIMKHATEDHLKRALIISYYTGTRPGKELFALTWQSIDWTNKTIRIISSKKNGLATRVIPLHPQLHGLLKLWQENDAESATQTIIHYRGKPITSVRKAFKTAKNKAGITRKLPVYAFRHAFATNMLAHGGDLKSTSEMLGHANTKITTSVYQHTSTELHRNNIDKLPIMDIDIKI